MFSLFWHTDTV